MFSRIRSLFRNLTHRGKVERDLAAEVDSYVDLSAQKKVSEGLSTIRIWSFGLTPWNRSLTIPSPNPDSALG